MYINGKKQKKNRETESNLAKYYRLLSRFYLPDVNVIFITHNGLWNKDWLKKKKKKEHLLLKITRKSSEDDSFKPINDQQFF